jgi:hypothetical protein
MIAFVGGQLLPVFIGIKEFAPETIHFVVSDESKGSITALKSFLSGKVFAEIVCDPFDFISIKSTCESIINRIPPNDEVHFNLTGGTKIMVLAAQSLISEGKVTGFYVNQNDTLLHLPTYQINKLNARITAKEFFEVSGHKLNNSKNINDFSKEDFKAAREIEAFSTSENEMFYGITASIRKKYDRLDKLPLSGRMNITLAEIKRSVKLSWDSNGILLESAGNNIFGIRTPNAKTIFFNAVWWELIVAKEISRWGKATELLIHCELPFKTSTKTPKNEIDILINLGGKLIFVECKSGLVKQEDINKMKVVKDTYGGIVSRAILVSRFKPHPTIIEKCSEVSIDIFYMFDDKTQVNSISKLLTLLDRVEKKSMI